MSIAPTPVARGHTPRLTQILVAALVILVAIAVVLLARNEWGGSSSSSGTEGSGVAATETRTVPSFTAVDLAGGNIVNVRVGERRSVVVNADDNLLDRITTNVRGSSLVVDDVGSFAAKSPMRVDITVPALGGVTLSGGGMIEIEGVEADEFVVRVPGSGILVVRGTADRLVASLDGSGDVQLQGLAARDVEAAVSGSGRLQVQATGSLDARISGSGAIFYSGDPGKVTQSVTGTGAILAQ